MNPDDERSQYYIEDTLLLKFLITRYTEMLGSEKSRLDPVWAGLGLTGLHQNRELESAFKILISSDSYSIEDVLNMSIGLFFVELQRLEATESAHYVEKKVERRPMTRRTARKFLFWSWREGRKMFKERDFRFYPIWEVVSWRTLNADEYIKGFEQRCLFSEAQADRKIHEGLEVIKAAIFKGRIDVPSFESYMHNGATPPSNKETQQ